MLLPTVLHPRTHRPAGAFFLLLLCALPVLVGCGSSHHSHEGFVLVDNRTDLTTNEFMLGFYLAPFGEPFTGNLLDVDLAPGATRNLGAWQEHHYDAEADLELGDLVEWFDIWVGNQETTVFEAQ